MSKFKKCKEGMKRNPITNRCKKVRQRQSGKEKTKTVKVPMVPDPVSVKTELVSVKNESPKLKLKKCPQGKIRNPRTNRCKKVEVKKELLKKKLPVVPPISFKYSFQNKESELGGFCVITKDEAHEFGLIFGVSDQIFKGVKNKRKADYCKIFTDFFPSTCLPNGWKLTRVLGKGLSGYVFASIGPNGQRGAFKVTKDETYNSIVSEMEMGNKFNEIGLSPEIKSYCRFTPPGSNVKLHILHMGRIDSTVDQYLSKKRSKEEINILVDKIFETISTIAEAGLTHGDLHSDNIGFIQDNEGIGKISLIDFGLSSDKISLPEIDAIQAIRQNYYKTPKERPTVNKKLFENAIKMKAKKTYGFSFDNIDYIEERFEQLRDQLEETL